jgi:hypothetical protein
MQMHVTKPMKNLILTALLTITTAFSAENIKISQMTQTTQLPTNTLFVVTVNGNTTRSVALETLVTAGLTNSTEVTFTASGGKVTADVQELTDDDISASANISASKLSSSVILQTEIDSESELENIMGIDLIKEDDIDTVAELEVIVGGVDFLLKTEIDSQPEFEALLFTLPTGGGGGSGDDVYVDNGNVTNPNFDNDGNLLWVVTGTNVVGWVTNILGNQITDATITADDLAADSVGASELNASQVESELELVLDLNELQGQIADAQIADGAVDGGTGGEIADGSITAADLGVDSVASSELDAASVESELEAVMDLQDMQGAVVSAQLPSINTLDSEWDTIAEIEAITAVNIIVATEIDSESELEAILGGINLVNKTAIDTQAEFEALLFTLPSGGSSGNWTDVGSTNSSLTGIAYAHQLQVTNGVIVVSGSASSYIELQENAAPSTPATDYGRIYTKTDNKLYHLSDAAVETALGNLTETEMEALIDLQDLQGAVTDAQVPNTITVDLATVATTANAGDSATLFFSSGTLEDARLASTVTLDSEWNTIGEIETATGVNIIISTEIDSLSEIETLLGSVNVLAETEIDASSELLALMDDETGTGLLVFGTSPTITTPTISGAIAFPDGVTQTFNPNGTSAGLNVGAHTADPSVLNDGDIWYDSDDELLRTRINGATVTITGSAGGLASTDIDTSGELRAIVTDESGTGALIFAGGNIAAATATSPSANDDDTSVPTTEWVQDELTGYDTDTRTLTTKTMSAASNDFTSWPVELGIAVSDETTALTTGTAKVTFRAPFAFTLTSVRANLNTTSSGAAPAIDINETGSGSIFSTVITIDAGEKTTATADVPAVITDTSIADDGEYTIDIDTAGTGAKGLKIWLIGTRTI